MLLKITYEKRALFKMARSKASRKRRCLFYESNESNESMSCELWVNESISPVYFKISFTP